MRINGKDIAKKLGISPSAVSLAINGKTGVSEETRERVMAEAVRMGYFVPKKNTPAARNVRYVIFMEDGDTVKETQFYSIVLQGIEARAKEHGYSVFVSYFYSDGDWKEQTAAACKDVSGLIILATEVTDRHIAMAMESGLQNQKLPIILVDNATSVVDVDSVVADSLRGAYRAVMYLLDKGHPDVGYLRSRSRIDNFDQREAGVLKARAERGIPDRLHVVDVGISSEGAYRDMCAWLDEGGRPRSAYFADNDIIAAACVRALRAKGFRVPQEVSVVGFDDMPICNMLDPTLSTVRVMKKQLGMTAMDILRLRIEERDYALSNPETGAYRMVVSTTLVERESVSAFPGTGAAGTGLAGRAASCAR